MVRARRSSSSGGCRAGAAAVEFALVAPFLFLVVLAIIEFGWAFRSVVLIANAARTGGRVAALAGKANSDVTSVVNSALSSAGLANGTVSVQVNSSTADASTAVTGDAVTVSVTVPVNGNNWLPTGLFLTGGQLSSSVVVRRE